MPHLNGRLSGNYKIIVEIAETKRVNSNIEQEFLRELANQQGINISPNSSVAIKRANYKLS